MKTLHKLGLINIVVLGVIALITPHEWYYLILTTAQLVFVPIVLASIGQSSKIVIWIAMLAYLSVILIQVTPDTHWHAFLAAVYLLYTILIAFKGFNRFLHRGFTHIEEILIDVAMVFLAIGGIWF